MANSVNLSWNDLIMRVANNVGIAQPTPFQTNSILYKLQDALVEIHGVSEDIKVIEKEYAVFDGKTPTHDITVAVLPGSTSLPNGVYKYAYSFYNTLLGETNLKTIGTADLLNNASQYIIISNIPSLPHGVEKIILYRTKANQETYYKHSEITTTSTINDTLSDTALVTPFDTAKTKFADMNDVSFPSDAFIVTQITFKNTEGVRINAQETVSEDEFTKLTRGYDAPEPETQVNTNGAIVTVPIVFEDLLYSGKIVYTLRSTYPLKFNYKPRFNGYISFNYTVIPEVTFSDLTQYPELPYMFRQLLISHATISYVKTLLIQQDSEKTSEARLQSLLVLIRIESAKYEELLKRYVSYTKRKIETSIVRLPDFLNDPSMEIF